MYVCIHDKLDVYNVDNCTVLVFTIANRYIPVCLYIYVGI